MSQDNSKKKPIPEREIALHVFACGGPITKCVLRPLEFPGRPRDSLHSAGYRDGLYLAWVQPFSA
jgi:hypothetical protein